MHAGPTSATKSRLRPQSQPRPSKARKSQIAGNQLDRWRLATVFMVMALALTAIVVRLAQVQVGSGSRLADVGSNQRLTSETLTGYRGSILDRNGAELAISLDAKTIAADPQMVTDAPAAAAALAPLLNLDSGTLEMLLSKDSRFTYLARRISNETAAAVARLNLKGVFIATEPQRHRPAGQLASSIIGTTGIDDQGLSGIEAKYQSVLEGTPGELLEERDVAGAEIPAGRKNVKEPLNGRHIQLTIDRTLQYETERILADQVVASRARGGIAVISDPTTGEILAMANIEVGRDGKPRGAVNNLAVTNVYEPGSVNKVVTIAGALEEGVVEATTRMNVPDRLQVSDGLFKDAEDHAPAWWSTKDILAESSNVGTILIGQRLGKQRIDGYLRSFGLARSTAVEFPGESAGLLPALKDWTGTSIATVPIGQGVAVTALQMLGAYNTIANGGLHVEPRLVRAIVDEGGKTEELPQAPSRRVVSAETASAVSDMLVAAVRSGTGTAAEIDNFTVAGKTGTARKPRIGATGYKEGAYLATFVGFVPAEAPRLSAIVILDEPTPYYGGLVSAPVFASLARFGVRYLGVAPRVESTVTRASAPGSVASGAERVRAIPAKVRTPVPAKP